MRLVVAILSLLMTGCLSGGGGAETSAVTSQDSVFAAWSGQMAHLYQFTQPVISTNYIDSTGSDFSAFAIGSNQLGTATGVCGTSLSYTITFSGTDTSGDVDVLKYGVIGAQSGATCTHVSVAIHDYYSYAVNAGTLTWCDVSGGTAYFCQDFAKAP